MGLSGEMTEQMCYYPTLTREEKARMHPCKRAKCVMTSADSSPTLQASVSSTQYPELPDEPRPGKIRPSTPTTSNNTNSTSPSPRGGTNSTTSSLGGLHNNNNNNNNNNGSGSHSNRSGSGADSPEVEAIEEAVPIVRSTLPSPEPRPTLVAERNGFKGSGLKLDNSDKVDGDIKFKTPNRDVDEDSCLIKCVYFTQQCCECTII